MPRIRTIKPEFWKDEDMASVSESACLLAIGLLNYADDEGYFNANERLIKAEIFPLREPSTTIRRMIDELSSIGYLQVKTDDSTGRSYGKINKFSKHQRVDRPKDSEIKHLVDFDDHSTKPRRSIDSGKEGKGKEMYSRVIQYLNEKAGKNYRCVDSQTKFIQARIDEGFTEEDLINVIDAKVSEWLGTKDEKYLRPETLFNATKFASYHGNLGSGTDSGCGVWQ